MKPRALFIAASLLAALPAISGSPATTGVPATPAGRVVGLWSNESLVGPCGATPAQRGRNTVIFNAGGTLVDNPRAPMGGAVQRSIGLGTWSYEPRTKQYSQHLQFDWFVNGAYDGYQTVDRAFVLSNDGNRASGAVVTTRYNADDSKRAEFCGNAVSTRL
jgi:hypothetical protein